MHWKVLLFKLLSVNLSSLGLIKVLDRVKCEYSTRAKYLSHYTNM